MVVRFCDERFVVGAIEVFLEKGVDVRRPPLACAVAKLAPFDPGLETVGRYFIGDAFGLREGLVRIRPCNPTSRPTHEIFDHRVLYSPGDSPGHTDSLTHVLESSRENRRGVTTPEAPARVGTQSSGLFTT
jgi:hypothetical protein